jgi:isopenicillin-N epimerase
MWTLDPAITFLNHGSFGACPEEVLRAQSELRAQLEREPVKFMSRELEGLLDEARAALAAFVGADPDDLAFVNNATSGVNTVLRSLSFVPGDEILTTNHAYGACKNAIDRVAARSGAKVVVAEIRFAGTTGELVEQTILARATGRTKLALIDHVTSPTALVFPIERIAKSLGERGIDTLVDGAHAPGMVPLDIPRIGAAYYTGNCHKWLCAPKGAALLWVRRDRQDRITPLVTSHGASSRRTDRSRFRLEHDYAGTDDPTAFLCVPHAIRWLESLGDFMGQNRALALEARRALLGALGASEPAPDSMIGSMASLPLADGTPVDGANLRVDPLQDELFHQHGIEVPIFHWPRPGKRLIRVSAQRYNRLEEYRRLAALLARHGGASL